MKKGIIMAILLGPLEILTIVLLSLILDSDSAIYYLLFLASFIILPLIFGIVVNGIDYDKDFKQYIVDILGVISVFVIWSGAIFVEDNSIKGAIELGLFFAVIQGIIISMTVRTVIQHIEKIIEKEK